MDDMTLYIIIGIFLALILYSIFRNNATRQSEPDYRQHGNEVPRHDDPNIRGSGSFGQEAQTQGREDLEWLRNRQNNAVNTPQQPSQSTNDSPNIRGQGGFGRDKK